METGRKGENHIDSGRLYSARFLRCAAIATAAATGQDGLAIALYGDSEKEARPDRCLVVGPLSNKVSLHTDAAVALRLSTEERDGETRKLKQSAIRTLSLTEIAVLAVCFFPSLPLRRSVSETVTLEGIPADVHSTEVAVKFTGHTSEMTGLGWNPNDRRPGYPRNPSGENFRPWSS
ncbi:hypothetical protein G7046_g278 [Stylonectria norvegica]|nr:hypothetical protein G7046_g278 [Stylonectria norvegica]